MLALLAMTIAPLPKIDPDALRATIAGLTRWPNRHTSSDNLTEAAEWLAGEYRKIPGAKVELMRYPVKKGARVAADKEVVQVICRLEPTESPLPGLIVMGGHMDTINMSGPADVTLKAPGANDDGSGTAAALEVARAMANRPRRHPLLFVAFSGEEQSLLGSTALAARAKSEGWALDAVLSNDMIGNARNAQGLKNSRQVRVFSEEVATHQSRELARYIEWLQRTEGAKGHAVKLVFRKDRFGRGGDHTPFNNAGFTAVRFCEAIEEYAHQHTPDDLPEYIDYDYFAKNTAVNLLVVDRLANAAPQPRNVRIDRKQGHDTTLTWAATPGVKYVVYSRDTASGTWQKAKSVGAVANYTLKKITKDDHEFAVGAEGGIPVPAA